MPCRDDYYCHDCKEVHCGYCPLSLSQKESKTLTVASNDLLCEALSLLEEHDLLNKASKKLQKWYKDHESAESNRVRLEAAQKLTKRERRLLNIDLDSLKKKVDK